MTVREPSSGFRPELEFEGKQVRSSERRDSKQRDSKRKIPFNTVSVTALNVSFLVS